MTYRYQQTLAMFCGEGPYWSHVHHGFQSVSIALHWRVVLYLCREGKHRPLRQCYLGWAGCSNVMPSQNAQSSVSFWVWPCCRLCSVQPTRWQLTLPESDFWWTKSLIRFPRVHRTVKHHRKIRTVSWQWLFSAFCGMIVKPALHLATGLCSPPYWLTPLLISPVSQLHSKVVSKAGRQAGNRWDSQLAKQWISQPVSLTSDLILYHLTLSVYLLVRNIQTNIPFLSSKVQ